MKYSLALLSVSSLLLNACVSGHCKSRYQDAKELEQHRESGSKELEKTFNPPPASPVSEKVQIYKPDGSLQCGMGKAISSQVMEAQLQGIKVYERKSTSDGMMHMALCGSATGQINVYTIDQADLSKAESLGFKKLAR